MPTATETKFQSPTEKKIAAAIAERRAPIEARAAHVSLLRTHASAAQAVIHDLHAEPTEDKIPKARKAASDLVAIRHLIEHFGEIDVETTLRDLVDGDRTLAPLLYELADEEEAYLETQRDKLRDVKIAEASLRGAPNEQLRLDILNFERAINVRAAGLESLRNNIKGWTENTNGRGPLGANSFFHLYGHLQHRELVAPKVHAEVK